MAIGHILLGIFLILWGLIFCLHAAVPPVLLGVLALVAGLLILVGR